MPKAEALLRATLRARETGRAFYVYSLSKGLWSYASASWINGMKHPPETLIEVNP